MRQTTTQKTFCSNLTGNTAVVLYWYRNFTYLDQTLTVQYKVRCTSYVADFTVGRSMCCQMDVHGACCHWRHSGAWWKRTWCRLTGTRWRLIGKERNRTSFWIVPLSSQQRGSPVAFPAAFFTHYYCSATKWDWLRLKSILYRTWAERARRDSHFLRAKW